MQSVEWMDIIGPRNGIFLIVVGDPRFDVIRHRHNLVIVPQHGPVAFDDLPWPQWGQLADTHRRLTLRGGRLGVGRPAASEKKARTS